MKARFAAGETFDGAIKRPVERRVGELAIRGRERETGRVQDGDDVAVLGAFEVLITLDQAVVGEAVRRLGQERLRLHFGVDRLGKSFAEGEAKDEGAEVVDVGDGAEILEEAAFAAEGNILAALCLRSMTPK